MSTDEETLKRDKLLLDLMIHAYDEDLARNELVDTKVLNITLQNIRFKPKYSDKNEHEHFAETGSMVAFNDIEDKTMAVQTDDFSHPIEFEKWIKRHPYKFRFILSQLRKIKSNEFTFKSFIDIFK